MTSAEERGELRSKVEAVIRRLLKEGSAVARSDGTVHQIFPVAPTGAEGDALRRQVIRAAASRTIEVGFGYGISTLFICDGLLANGEPTSLHVVIDPYQSTRFGDCGLQSLDEAGIGHMVELHPDESQTVLPRFLGEGRSFDLAFVDGNHRFDGVFLDLVYLGRLLRPGSIIFLDDYHLPAVARAASFCLKNLEWSLEEVSTTNELHGWAVLRTSRAPDTRPFDHFVDF